MNNGYTEKLFPPQKKSNYNSKKKDKANGLFQELTMEVMTGEFLYTHDFQIPVSPRMSLSKDSW